MPRSAHKLTIPAALISGAFLFGAGLTGCKKTESTATLVAEAQTYQQKGDNKAALIQLKNAAVQSPDDAAIRLQLAQLYTTMGDALSAEKEIRKAMSLGTPAATGLPVLANALFVQGQHKKLLEETDAAAAKGPAALLVTRGNAQLLLNEPDKAKASYEAALAAEPNNGNALIGLAMHATSLKDAEGAKRLAQEAAQKDPKNPEVWMYQGMMAVREGKPDAALAAFSQALTLKPDHRTAHIEKAYVEIGAGKFDAARADIAAARKITPGSVIVTYTQALLDHTEGKHDAALESIQKVLRVAPEHMPSVLLAGAIQLSLGSYQQAEQNLKKYLAEYPDTLYARKLLASTLLRSQQPADAAAALAPALEGNSADPQLLALAGEAYMQTRDFDKASSYLEKAAGLAPKAASVRTSLGLAKLGQGDNAQAISELELATTLDPKSPQAGLALVRTQLGLKQYDKALASVNSMLATQPDNAMLHNMKGGVFLSKGDVAAARASFDKALALQPSYFAAVVNLAQLDMQAKKPQDAKARFTAFLEKDKKHSGAMMALAELANRENKAAEATGWLEKAANANPEAIAPSLQLVQQYVRTGANDKALTLARKLQTNNPTNPDLLDVLGQVQMASKDHAAALETYSKVAALMPKSAAVQLRLAGVHTMMKNDAAAMDDVKRALSLDPTNVQAQLALIDLAVRKQDTAGALALARNLQKQYPKVPMGHVIEGDIHMVQKKPDLALRAYDQAFALRKEGRLMLKSVQSLKQLGKDAEANARLAAYHKANPNDPAVAIVVGGEQLDAKQFKPAIATFENIVKNFPEQWAAWNNLAYAYQQEKDARALSAAEKAYALAPQNPAVLDTLGWILVEQGNTARAVPLLQQAVSRAPNSSEIRYHLASGLFKAGDKAKARKELDQALAGESFAQIEQARALLKLL